MTTIPLDLQAKAEMEKRRRAKEQSTLHSSYRDNPIGWAEKFLGLPRHTFVWSENPNYDTHVWDGTKDPIAALMESVSLGKDTGVESGTGTGKSYTLAVLILHFLATWESSRVFTFAPKEDQLRLYIWKEIGVLWPRFEKLFPLAKKTDLAIRMRGGTDDSWGARGIAVGVQADEQVSTKASGMHAEHMMLVYEEMQLVPEPVIEAGKNACTAPHNFIVGIGNPNHQLDGLHKFCVRLTTTHIRVSALDHPNVVTEDENLIPGAASKTSVTKRLEEYGENDPVYLSRVRGISPEQATNALIHLQWLRESARRYALRAESKDLPRLVSGRGVDVANSLHGDEASICDFLANACPKFPSFACPDSNALGRKVAADLNLLSLPPERCGVDAIGVGAGTINELRRLGKTVMALYGSGRPMMMVEKEADGSFTEWTADVNKFQNLRAQMYWQAREDLRLGVIDVEEDAELWEELIAPTYVDEPKVKIEPKEDIVERLGRSPNKGDAFVYANWVRKRHLPKPTKAPPGKEPDRAWPLKVEHGKLVANPKEPQTFEEWADWHEQKTQRSMFPARSSDERRDRAKMRRER
jgi:hypothetical protein